MKRKQLIKELDKGTIRKAAYVIGIDTGVNTGIAMWDKQGKRLKYVDSVSIHTAIIYIEHCIQTFGIDNILVRVEDARKRIWFGKAGREQLQGAGSIKRDGKIWEDYLADKKIAFELVSPKNNKTKLDASTFKKVTGWPERTNEHARDATMLVFGL
jgi:hypothetical protein